MTCILKDEINSFCLNGEDDDKDGVQDCLETGCKDKTAGSINISWTYYTDLFPCCLSNFSGSNYSCLDDPCPLITGEEDKPVGVWLPVGCSANRFWGSAIGDTTISIAAPQGLWGEADLISPARIYYPGPESPVGNPTVPPIFLWDGSYESWTQEMEEGETVLVVFDPFCPEDTPFCPVP